MTERKRVLTLLAGGRPDRVPWFGDLDYWATSLIGRGLKPAGFKESDAYIDWHRDLRVGFYLQGYFPFKTIVKGRAFGSPLARGLYPRASTAEVDPRASPGPRPLSRIAGSQNGGRERRAAAGSRRRTAS